MKTFRNFLEEVDTLDTLHDPGIRSYYSRHRVTPQNRKDFETIRKIILITLEAGPSARRRLSMLLNQLGKFVPEIQPLVSQLGVLTAQDGRDARKLFDPTDIDQDILHPDEEEGDPSSETGEEEFDTGDDEIDKFRV